MLFKRHLQISATMTDRSCNRETTTNRNASIRQSCSGVMSAFCVPFRVFLVQAWQCSCVNKKQIWVLLHTFTVEPHPPRGAGVVTLTAAVSPCMQELSSVPGTVNSSKMSLTKVSQTRGQIREDHSLCLQKSSAIMESTGTSTGQRGESPRERLAL